MSDVKIIKLISGENLITEVIDYDNNIMEGMWELKNPAVLFYAPKDGDPERPDLQFMPFRSFGPTKKSDDLIVIKDDHVIASYEPNIDLKDAYNQVYGTIVIASPQESNVITSDKFGKK